MQKHTQQPLFSYDHLQQPLYTQLERLEQAIPEQTALITDTASFTYAELAHSVRNMAHAIATQTDSRFIGLFLDDPLHVVVGVFAISRLGRTAMPISTRTPHSTLKEYLKQFDAPALLTTHNQLAIEGLEQQNIYAEDVNFKGDNDAVGEARNPQLPFMVLSTPNTTGVIGGIPIAEDHYLRGAYLSGLSWNANAETVLGSVGTFAFFGSLSPLLYIILFGGTAHALTIVHNDFQSIQEKAQAFQVLYIAPSLFRAVFKEDYGYDFSKVTSVSLGGETVYHSDVDLFRQRFTPPTRLTNIYGSTEVGLVAFYAISHDTKVPIEGVPVGTINPIHQVLLLGEDDEPVKKGEMGEIVVKSESVFEGYWRNAELTAQRVSQDFDNPRIRIFRTGDYGVLLSNGDLLHMGRKDSQVKVNGFRVDVGMIEGQLLSHPQIAEAVVQAYKEGSNTVLATYLVAKPEHPQLSVAILREFLGKRVADYMVPATFLYVKELPKNHDNTINRDRLPDPKAIERTRVKPIVAPRDSTEQKVYDIWKKVLGEHVTLSVNDDFFDVGGDSITATQLISKLNRAFNITFTPATFYDYNSVEAQAKIIDTGEIKHMLHPSLIAIRSSGTRLPLFCVHGGVPNPLQFIPLSRELGEDYPIYSFQAPPRHSEYMGSFEKLVNHYVEGIKSLKLRVPIYLMGESGGGVVAYEMARRLAEENIEVYDIFMLDSHFPQVILPDGDDTPKPNVRDGEAHMLYESRYARFQRQVNTVWKAYRVAFHTVRPLSSLPRQLWRILNMSVSGRHRWVSFQTMTEQEKSLLVGNMNQFNHGYAGLVSEYAPNRYEGKLTYFKALGGNPNFLATSSSPDVEWQTMVKEFGYQELHCQHGQMLLPGFVKELADIVRPMIEPL